jgi:serine/threonine-protein kinase RsbW
MAILKLFADLDQLKTIREFVVQSGRDMDLDEQTTYELELAVDEACTNIVRHAYGGKGGEIEVTVEPREDGACVTLRDWGKSFDPDLVPTPDVTAPLEERDPGGLGLFLIRSMVDDVHFEFDAELGNTLTMVKKVRGRGEGQWT